MLLLFGWFFPPIFWLGFALFSPWDPDILTSLPKTNPLRTFSPPPFHFSSPLPSWFWSVQRIYKKYDSYKPFQMAFPPSCPIFCQSAEFTPLPHSPSLSVLSSKGPLSVVKCNWSQGEFLVPMQEPLQITCSVTGGPHQSLSREARERKEVLFTASTL